MTASTTPTVRPRRDRQLVHQVRTLGHCTAYDRMTARTVCGKYLTGWIGAVETGTPVTCSACLAAAPAHVVRAAVDSLGVPVRRGDRVIVNSWGQPVRLIDVGQRGTVVGFARTRVVVQWDRTSDAPVRNVPPGNLGVLRRDGADGFEGNAGN